MSELSWPCAHTCQSTIASKHRPWQLGPGRRRSARALLPICCTALAILLGAGQVQAQAQVEPKAKVAFIGDSTADGLWGGVARLVPRDSCLKGNVELGRFAKNSTGLTRPDRFNWADEIRRIGDSFKPSLFVMSLGLNDRQSVVVEGKVTLETTPEYPAKYKERVTAVLKNVGREPGALLWVGLPAMRDAAPDRDAREKNKLFAEAIAEFGDRRDPVRPALAPERCRRRQVRVLRARSDR